jgi:predicted acetyltransferase
VTTDVDLRLVKPNLEMLPQYVSALRRGGWSPDNTRPASVGEELRRINEDAAAFIESLDDPEARGAPVTLADGSKVPRLPGFRRWLSASEFCGFVGFRWQHGTSALPPWFLFGHIGFGVVPWKRRLGYATKALSLILPEARQRGLAYVELTCDADNVPSQKVITSNGGRFVERFRKPDVHGGAETLRFRIVLLR